MTAGLDLDPDQRDELARLLGGDSLGALLNDWSRFVTEVERGYRDSIYEYENDLSVRDLLERVVTAASPGLRAKLERAVADDDRRFRAATEETDRPLRALGDPPWWWRRVPTRLVGELADDLESYG
jgi:hypothetical protein